MKKLWIFLMLCCAVLNYAFAQCPAYVTATNQANGQVDFMITGYTPPAGWDVDFYAYFGDSQGGSYTGTSVSHTYNCNGTYYPSFSIHYYSLLDTSIYCTIVTNVTVNVSNATPPPIACNVNFTAEQYCMDSIYFNGTIPQYFCNYWGEFNYMVTDLGDTLPPGQQHIPYGFSPWPSAVTIFYGYTYMGNPYQQCSTTVSVPAFSPYQLDLFVDTNSASSIVLHDTSSTNMFFGHIDWGDGSSENNVNAYTAGHNYLLDGTYLVNADAYPSNAYNSPNCYTYDSVYIDIMGQSNSMSCNLIPSVTYSSPQTLEYSLHGTFFSQHISSDRLNVSWSFDNGYTSVQDYGVFTSVTLIPTSYTVSYEIYDYWGNLQCVGSMLDSINSGFLQCNASVYIYEDSLTPGVFWGLDQSSGGVQPYSYLWDFGDGDSSTQQYPSSHIYTNPGVYNVCLTITDSQLPPCVSTYCDSVDSRAFSPMWQFNVVNPTIMGMQEQEEMDFTMYPNPAYDVVMLNMNDVFGNNGTVSILDLTGKIISSQQVQGGGTFTIDLTHLTTGMYFLTVSDGKNSRTQKFIKH